MVATTYKFLNTILVEIISTFLTCVFLLWLRLLTPLVSFVAIIFKRNTSEKYLERSNSPVENNTLFCYIFHELKNIFVVVFKLFLFYIVVQSCPYGLVWSRVCQLVGYVWESGLPMWNLYFDSDIHAT